MPLGTLQYITLCASVFLKELTLGVNTDDSYTFKTYSNGQNDHLSLKAV